jgi:hypothetical protein
MSGIEGREKLVCFEQCGAVDQYFRFSDVATLNNRNSWLIWQHHLRHIIISSNTADGHGTLQQTLRPARCNEESRPEKYTAFGTEPLPFAQTSNQAPIKKW